MINLTIKHPPIKLDGGLCYIVFKQWHDVTWPAPSYITSPAPCLVAPFKFDMVIIVIKDHHRLASVHHCHSNHHLRGGQKEAPVDCARVPHCQTDIITTFIHVSKTILTIFSGGKLFQDGIWQKVSLNYTDRGKVEIIMNLHYIISIPFFITFVRCIPPSTQLDAHSCFITKDGPNLEC